MELRVWAERMEGFVRVGSLSIDDVGEESFAYADSYLSDELAVPIYPSLPLRQERFAMQATRAAFSSLGPEGAVGHEVRVSLRAGRDAIAPVLARLNNETVGALAFTDESDAPAPDFREPQPLDEAFLEEFSRNPERVAYETLLASRLSINGAVSKIGVIGRGGSWFVPGGLSPSTHIMKASSKAFANQMLNEALCMRCASACGFYDAAETGLVVVEGQEPLLVSRRFDRIEVSDRPSGLSAVMRLHQADFCQVLGISVDALKYTPSDELIESYTSSVANAISHESSERYGDRSYVFDILAFDYLMGNCDNHLKNLSLTWTADWKTKAVSPIYDVTCTTVYDDLSRDMGMGIGFHRLIDAVEPEDFVLLARWLGVGWVQARDSLAELADRLENSLMDVAHELEREYGVSAVEVAELLARDSRPRVEIVRKAALL